MYRGYRRSTCTSINHVVCHGIPGEKPLKEGDIVNIDVTLILDGWHGDSSRMYAVGEIPRRAERLIDVTYEAMMRGIAVIKPGRTTGDVGAAIQAFVEEQHMSVVRDFCGHGLGRLFHDEPNIVHVGRPGEGVRAQAGHVLHRRADDQSRPPAREGPVRRLDRGDPRPLAVGPVRAFGRRHRDRRGNLHPLAARARQAAFQGAGETIRPPADVGDASHRRYARRAPTSVANVTIPGMLLPGGPAGLSRCAHLVEPCRNRKTSRAVLPKRRIFTAIANACATRFLEAGTDAAQRLRAAGTGAVSGACRAATSSRWPRR